MKKRSDFFGLEFDWFAVDADGFLALMISAGYGPVPDSVFRQLDQQRLLGEHLTTLSGYSINAEWDQMVRSVSASGVFVYNWEHWEGPYQRLGVPPHPQRFDELGFSPELQDALITLPERFSMRAELRPELCLPCNGHDSV